MVSVEPEFVNERLINFRQILAQDIETLRTRRVSAKHNLPFYPQFENESAYLRSFLLISMTAKKASPQDSTPAAWFPFILKYCRTLDVDPSVVDQFFRRIVSGDLSDRRICESESDKSLQVLDMAISLSREKWLEGSISKKCEVSGYYPLEILILQALDGVALKLDPLAHAIGYKNSDALYKKSCGGNRDQHVLEYMKAKELIAHSRRMGGFYRPDRPPGLPDSMNATKK